ncbi:MAG: RNA-binding protein [Chloroflexi bacterium]|nr:RNA-binding protein [Chloroflexota bacterium]
MRIFVGNLSFESTDSDLHTAFAEYGQVTSAQVVKDRDTNRSRGFGFVEMQDASQAKAAIAGLNGKEVKGRALTVNEARERSEGAGPRGGQGGSSRFGSRQQRSW